MVLSYSNYTEKTRHLYDSEMTRKFDIWRRNTNIHETIENLGFAVQKRIRSWHEDKYKMTFLKAFLTGFTFSLGGTYEIHQRKVTDTEYLVDNNVVTEQKARNTVRERDGERRRQVELEEQQRKIRERQIELEEQLRKIREREFERQRKLEEQLRNIQEREFEKQRELEEQQGIIEIGGQLEKLISRGALEMHYEINNYEEKEYKNHLFETHKMLEYALEFNLEPKKINFLLLRNSLLNQGLFFVEISDLSDNKNSNQNQKIIVLLDYVIDSIENAIALLNGLENIPTGNLHETLEDLKIDANEQRQECQELIQSNQVSLNEITAEQRIRNLQEIGYQANVAVRQLNEIVQNQELFYRHLDG